MQAEYSYAAQSSVQNNSQATGVSFQPDLSRDPTYFHGELADPLLFREAMSALHDVVVSDRRWQPKDRSDYLAWVKEQESADLQAASQRFEDLRQQIEPLREELREVNGRLRKARKPFYDAQRKYFRG